MDVVDVALYTRHLVRHSLFNEQFRFDLQLHLRLLLSFFLLRNLKLFFFDVSNIASAAITYIQSVQIENIMVFIVLGEVFSHKLDEQFTNICFHILAIWWA